MEKVKKAVILAAGFGTRVLPASKAIPKEMLNIVDKPAIQYIVEEVINSGITEILIVLSRGKQEVEDHFDRKPDLEAQLLAGGKTEFYITCSKIFRDSSGTPENNISVSRCRTAQAALLCMQGSLSETIPS